MALLLEVSEARPYDRAALRSALRRAGLPRSISVTPLPSTAPRMRVHSWELGDGTALLRLESTGIAVARSAPRPGETPVRRMGVAVLSPGEWRLNRAGDTVAPVPGEPTLVAVDDATRFDFRRGSTGTILALHFDCARINLATSTTARAMRGLHSGNSLYGLVRTYLQQLATVASANEEMLPELHSTTMDLIRALLLNAADDPDAVPANPDTVQHIRRFIEDHLDDSALCAEMIAAAHNISPRQLYKVWARTGTGLADHIIGRRLDRARETLRAQRHLTITAVAHRHGFSDPTHFAHRFRAAYGVTPSQWRHGAATGIAVASR